MSDSARRGGFHDYRTFNSSHQSLTILHVLLLCLQCNLTQQPANHHFPSLHIPHLHPPTMSLFGQSKRHIPNLTGSKGRRSPLPLSSSDAVHDKYSHGRSGSLSSPIATSSASGWFTVVYVPLPRIFGRSDNGSPRLNGIEHRFAHTSRRRMRVYLPIPPSLYRHLPFGRPFTPLRACVSLLLFVVVVFILTGFRRHRGGKTVWTPPFQDADTLVLTKDEIARIWEWEILSGHQPSPRKISESSRVWGMG